MRARDSGSWSKCWGIESPSWGRRPATLEIGKESNTGIGQLSEGNSISMARLKFCIAMYERIIIFNGCIGGQYLVGCCDINSAGCLLNGENLSLEDKFRSIINIVHLYGEGESMWLTRN